MKYILYAMLTFVALLLFLPRSTGAPVRNLPLLILLLALLLLTVLVRLFKYAILHGKNKGAAQTEQHPPYKMPLFAVGIAIPRTLQHHLSLQGKDRANHSPFKQAKISALPF